MKNKIFITAIITLVVCLVSAQVLIANSNKLHKKIYKHFYETKLYDFFEENEINLTEEEKASMEYYIIDLKNSGELSLLLVYGDHEALNQVIEYKLGKFRLEEPLDLFTNVGSGGSDYKKIMRKESKTYYYSYTSERLEYGENSRWAIKEYVYTYEDGEKIVVEELKSDNGIDYSLNGEKIDHYPGGYDPTKEYETIVDSRAFLLE